MAQPRTNPTPEWPAHYTTLAPFATLFRQGLPILTYHVIGPRPWRAKMKGLYLSPILFDRQLAELRQAGFITPPYDRTANSHPAPRAEILLTMDDGVRKTSECSLPILQKHGCHAIQFVVAHCIGRTNEWQTRKGEVEERLMDEAEIRDWLAAGQSLGSHTLSHPWLTRITPAEAREEITASKKLLEDRFGRRIDHFCYPYGNYDARVADLVAEAGYRTACTTVAGMNLPSTPPYELKRFTARYRSRNWRNLAEWFTRLGRSSP